MSNLQSKGLNILLFIERVLFALAFIYLAIGEALHLNAFIQNGIDIGLPYAHIICTCVVFLTFLLSAFMLIGIAWKAACFGLMFISLFSGFFFFAGAVNKVNIIGVLFAFVILLNFLAFGAGALSIDNYLANRPKKQNKRLSDIV